MKSFNLFTKIKYLGIIDHPFIHNYLELLGGRKIIVEEDGITFDCERLHVNYILDNMLFNFDEIMQVIHSVGGYSDDDNPISAYPDDIEKIIKKYNSYFDEDNILNVEGLVLLHCLIHYKREDLFETKLNEFYTNLFKRDFNIARGTSVTVFDNNDNYYSEINKKLNILYNLVFLPSISDITDKDISTFINDNYFDTTGFYKKSESYPLQFIPLYFFNGGNRIRFCWENKEKHNLFCDYSKNHNKTNLDDDNEEINIVVNDSSKKEFSFYRYNNIIGFSYKDNLIDYKFMIKDGKLVLENTDSCVDSRELLMNILDLFIKKILENAPYLEKYVTSQNNKKRLLEK